MNPEDILDELFFAEEKSLLSKGITNAVRQYIFVDPLIPSVSPNIPGIGNKLAFNLFNKKKCIGYYVFMDVNDFKQINTKLGHMIGDYALQMIGYALRDATIKCEIFHYKLFRSGGDEFVLFCERKDKVLEFVENAKKEIDKIIVPCTMTMSFGIGKTLKESDDALHKAKEMKKQSIKHIIFTNILI